jgi:hypothetical protein
MCRALFSTDTVEQSVGVSAPGSIFPRRASVMRNHVAIKDKV